MRSLDLRKSLSDEEWNMSIPADGRTIGVIIHHVASVYPIEVHLAKSLAGGQTVPVTKANVDAMNAKHAEENKSVGKD